MNSYLGIDFLPVVSDGLRVPSEENLDLTLLGHLSLSGDEPSYLGQE